MIFADVSVVAEVTRFIFPFCVIQWRLVMIVWNKVSCPCDDRTAPKIAVNDSSSSPAVIACLKSLPLLRNMTMSLVLAALHIVSLSWTQFSGF